MKRSVVLLVALVAVIALGACSREQEKVDLAPEEFCEAAARLDFDLGSVSPEEQLELVANVAAVAPPEIKPDADLFSQGMQKVIVDDEPITDEAERVRYENASNRVQKFSIDHCGLLEQGSSPFSGR